MNHLDINQIKDIIPHRHPFLLIDYIEDYVRVSMLLDINVYHTVRSFLPIIFRRNPVMPGCFDNRGTGADGCSCNSFTSRK